jgi:hypothetical protein
MSPSDSFSQTCRDLAWILRPLVTFAEQIFFYNYTNTKKRVMWRRHLNQTLLEISLIELLKQLIEKKIPPPLNYQNISMPPLYFLPGPLSVTTDRSLNFGDSFFSKKHNLAPPP